MSNPSSARAAMSSDGRLLRAVVIRAEYFRIRDELERVAKMIGDWRGRLNPIMSGGEFDELDVDGKQIELALEVLKTGADRLERRIANGREIGSVVVFDEDVRRLYGQFVGTEPAALEFLLGPKFGRLFDLIDDVREGRRPWDRETQVFGRRLYNDASVEFYNACKHCGRQESDPVHSRKYLTPTRHRFERRSSNG